MSTALPFLVQDQLAKTETETQAQVSLPLRARRDIWRRASEARSTHEAARTKGRPSPVLLKISNISCKMATQGEKRAHPDSQEDGTKAVLLDIEGTTTPISFVKVSCFSAQNYHAELSCRRQNAARRQQRLKDFDV